VQSHTVQQGKEGWGQDQKRQNDDENDDEGEESNDADDGVQGLRISLDENRVCARLHTPLGPNTTATMQRGRQRHWWRSAGPEDFVDDENRVCARLHAPLGPNTTATTQRWRRLVNLTKEKSEATSKRPLGSFTSLTALFLDRSWQGTVKSSIAVGNDECDVVSNDGCIKNEAVDDGSSGDVDVEKGTACLSTVNDDISGCNCGESKFVVFPLQLFDTDENVTCFSNGGGAISACNGGTRTSEASLIDDNCDSDLMEDDDEDGADDSNKDDDDDNEDDDDDDS
jgi:hypothetical protein